MGNGKKFEKWIEEKLDVRIKFNDMCTSGDSKKRIITKCKNEEEKGLIIKNRRKLGNERVYIDNDLTWNERRIRKKILEKARELKKQGKRVKIGYHKVKSEEKNGYGTKEIKRGFKNKGKKQSKERFESNIRNKENKKGDM